MMGHRVNIQLDHIILYNIQYNIVYTYYIVLLYLGAYIL